MDSLGDRLKERFEDRTRYYLPRRAFAVLRVDGKAFHTFTRKCTEPFDSDLITAIDYTAMNMCKEMSGVVMAYTQSDEISVLLCDFQKQDSQGWFDYNVQKMTSVSASLATGFFNSIPSGIVGNNPFSHIAKFSELDVNDWLLMADTELAYFDSRAFGIPDKVEVANYFSWRIKDWERNSLQMLARKYYSHGELHGKDRVELHDMLHEASDNWANLGDIYKRGRVCTRHIGGMWGIYPAPDITNMEGKAFLKKLIPEHGYGYKNDNQEEAE